MRWIKRKDDWENEEGIMIWLCGEDINEWGNRNWRKNVKKKNIENEESKEKKGKKYWQVGG